MNATCKPLKADFAESSSRILSMKILVRATGLSKSTIYAYVKLGQFPAQIKLGIRRVGWLEHEVQEWLKNRVIKSRPTTNTKYLKEV